MVATIETPSNHHGAARPEVKNSAVLLPARRAMSRAGMKVSPRTTTTIVQSRFESGMAPQSAVRGSSGIGIVCPVVMARLASRPTMVERAPSSSVVAGGVPSVTARMKSANG